MKKPTMIICIVLTACIGFIAAQSTSLNPTPTIQQTFAVPNHTAMPNASMTVPPKYSATIHQTSVHPSSTIKAVSNPNSIITSTSPSTTIKDDEDDNIEEDADKKKKTAIIAASCGGVAVLLIGLTLVTWTHRKDGDT